MKTAKELRTLRLVHNISNPKITLQSLVERRIDQAGKAGMSQADIEVYMNEYTHDQLMSVKRGLLKLGFAVITGQVSGVLGTNLIVPAKYSLKVMW